jgi:eukaryotic-like serine/threonine-protein kinase
MSRQRLAELFELAVELAPGERADWIATACAGDEDLRAQLEHLLRADQHAVDFLEKPPALIAASVQDGVAAMPEAPRQFGPWRVLRSIGVGGMGEVWLAERGDGEFEQRVAIKQLAYPTPGLLHRFRQERQILARLEHASIARLIDGGVDAAGAPYLVMEYVEGEPITAYVRSHAQDLRACLDLFLGVCEGVQYAHQNLVVHRDLKPSNIFVTAEGVPKLLDFGIAKVLAATDDAAATQTAARLLTPDYAAPEQFGGGAITTATDVYALGVVLHELLTGTRPPRHDPAGVNAEPRLPSASVERTAGTARRRALRGDLDRIVLTALAREPQHRYASAEALAQDIRRHLDGRPVAARGRSAGYRLRKFAVRNRYVLAAAVLAFVICLGAMVVSLQQARLARAQAQRSDAVQSFLIGVFEQAAPDNSMSKPITARQLLEVGERQLAQGELVGFGTRAELIGLIGDLYWSIGDYTKAEALLKQAVSPAENAGVPDVVRARTLRWLARTEREKELFDAAIGHAEEALVFARRAGRDGVSEVSDLRRTLADAYTGKGDAEKAVPLLRDALASDRLASGSRSQDVVDDLALLANALKETSRYDESIGASREVVDTATAMHGRANSNVVNGLELLASALGHRGDFAAAEKNLREAVSIAEKVFGPDHRETVVARSNLFWTLEMQGRFAEALEGRLRLLASEQAMDATRPEQMAYAYDFLASDYSALGRFEDAESAARKSLDAWKGIHGPEPDWNSCDTLRNLGIVFMLTGRYADAQDVFHQTVGILALHEPPTSEWLNRDRGTLGEVMRLAHRPADAVREISEALAALPPVGAKASPIRIYLLGILGEAQLDAGDTAAAESTAVRALAAARDTIPAGSLKLGQPLFALARVRLARGQPGEAEPLLREALSVRQAVEPPGDPRMLEVQVALINALAAQGRASEARTLLLEVEPALKASRSPYAADLLGRLAAR